MARTKEEIKQAIDSINLAWGLDKEIDGTDMEIVLEAATESQGLTSATTKSMSYSELTDAIAASPSSWSGGLLCKAIEKTKRVKFFQDEDGFLKFCKNVFSRYREHENETGA